MNLWHCWVLIFGAGSIVAGDLHTREVAFWMAVGITVLANIFGKKL